MFPWQLWSMFHLLLSSRKIGEHHKSFGKAQMVGFEVNYSFILSKFNGHFH
jgi:hypothetical protein